MLSVRVVAGRAPMALLTAISLALAPTAPLVAQSAPPAQAKPTQAPAPAKAPAANAAPAATPEAPVGPADRGWPRSYTTASGGAIVVYQPQIASWDEQLHAVAYAAVAYEAKGSEGKPAFGSVRIEADTKVALAERLVSFTGFKLLDPSFPSLQKDQVKEVVAEIQKAIPEDERVIALDRVLAGLDRSQIRPKNVEGVKAEPPKIFFSDKPAVLVNLDGEAIWSPIKDNDLKFAVNTNWDLFEHVPSKTFYLRHEIALRNENAWLKAGSLDGPWTAAGDLPESFRKLPDGDWHEVKVALPGKKLSGKEVPKVFVSTTPAEIIALDGPQKLKPIDGTKLSWVSNTESDVFREGKNGAVYYLVAGRWFKAPGFEGPWVFTTPNLPEDFRRIPLEHPRSRVLASVPGTAQAAEAVLIAQIPQTARVNKKELKAPEVTYQGEPKFEKVEKTSLERAVNTDKDILKVGDKYYLCYQGVWFVAASAEGPWTVTDSVPGQVYEIPISSPVHNVTYVTVQEDKDDDEWVTFATAAAYTGVMVAWGCAVWGSGWYYPPYYGYGGFYPYYYPHYPTYGYAAHYNPWTGAYGRGAVAYGPYGGAGVSARYNPRTGTYSRGASAWGPYGSRSYREAYNPRTGAYGATRQGSGVYGSWGSTAVQRGDQWAQTSRVTNNVTGNTTRVTRTDSGAAAVTRRGPGADGGVVRTGSGDVYAGRDGNVYRRGDSGGWERYDGGSWGAAERPTPTTRDRSTSGTPSTMDQVNRDARARAEGSQRTRDYGGYQRSGGSRSAGSTYRPSGGGMRGGGGRRR